MPFPPLDRPPRNRALAIGRWQEAACSLPPIELPTDRFPPLLTLSLDPTDRLERAFREAGVPFSVVTRQEPPARDRPSLIKLGGDLATRAGLLLSWDDVRAAGQDADVVHLLAEARRAAQGGTVLAWAPAPDEVLIRLWRALLGPALRGAARTLALGSADFPWPEPLRYEAGTLGEALRAWAVEAAPARLPDTARSRKGDLEGSIRESYAIVRDYEFTLRTSTRAEEKQWAQRRIDEQWGLIERYLDEYGRLTGGLLPAEIDEIAAHFRDG
jgi:hypothetical protein